MKCLIDYTLNRKEITNPDGTAQATIVDCEMTAGPVQNDTDPNSKALLFGAKGQIKSSLPETPNSREAWVRLVLNLATVDKKEHLFSCQAIGIHIWVAPSENPQKPCRIIASIKKDDWGAYYTATNVPAGVWFTLDLAYNEDALGCFIDDELRAMLALPQSWVAAQDAAMPFTLGGPMNAFDFSNSFGGVIAGLKIWNGIPENLEAELEKRRNSAIWHISMKANQASLGVPTHAPKNNLEKGYIHQVYELGAVFFDPADGQAACLTSNTFEYWLEKPDLQDKLGNLQYDVMSGRKPGSQKAVFENGAIYCSDTTGARAILGKKQLGDYIKMGEGASKIGLPKTIVAIIPGGWMQRFETGYLYYNEKNQSTIALPDAIADQYHSEGGYATWGLPVSESIKIRRKIANNASVTLGTITEFEKNAAVFQKQGATKAYLVTDAILKKYMSNAVGGPMGSLGFPTGNLSISQTGIKHMPFEHGAIVTIGNKTLTVPAFTIFIQRVETSDSEYSEFFQGQNDLYMYFKVKIKEVAVFNKRYPESGAIERNIVEPKIRTQVFTPNDPEMEINLNLNVNESDDGNDDHMGVFEKTLNLSNAWGLLDRADGIFNSGKISKINNVVWSVQPEVTENTPFDFWETGNKTTQEISKEQYAKAFFDVDPDQTWSDWLNPADWLRKLYYEVYVKKIAEPGNCFGLSAEAIYSWKQKSLFGRPLSRFNDFSTIEHEINIRHCAQAGAEQLGWVFGQLLKGNLNNPKAVFRESRNCFNNKNNPILGIASDWKFSDGHLLMPVAWNDDKPIWEIEVYDPNNNNNRQIIEIDPEKNTYKYKSKYEGGSGFDNFTKKGSLYYIPWSMLDSIPYTPIGDFGLFGMTILYSGQSQMLSLLDENGDNLYANNNAETLFQNKPGMFYDLPRIDSGATGGLLTNLQTPPQGFSHTLNGKSDGQLDYAFVWKRQALKLSMSGKKSERNTVSMANIGSSQQITSLESTKSKLLAFTTSVKLNDGADNMDIEIEKIAVKANLKTQISNQPGSMVLDILSSGEAVDLPVTIRGRINGNAFEHRYVAPVEGGTRLIFSQALSSESLKKGKIDQLHGVVREVQTLNRTK